MEIATLYKIDFDVMENNEPIRKIEIGTFGPKGHLTAVGNLDNNLHDITPQKLYMGWDKEIYPKYIIETKNLK